MSETLTQCQVNNCYSYSDVCRLMGWPLNGTYSRKAKRLVENLDISHFGSNPKSRKYERITKDCPICEEQFQTLKGHPREKKTCSRGCANTYFRSGSNNPNWKESAYRTTCFEYHKKECVVCKESRIVEVHHLNEDPNDNSLANLIPLCPTHHQYWHSQYKCEVEPKIRKYIEEWKKKQ